MSQALRQIVILARNKKSYDVVKRQKSNVIQLNGGADCRIHFSVIVQRGASVSVRRVLESSESVVIQEWWP
jgi:hypothetical protein